MRTVVLGRCQPGTRFRVPGLGVTGLRLYTNECRARVRIDQPPREVEITGRDGRTRRFVANRRHETDWAPSVPVVPIGTEPVPTTKSRDKETTMATKKTAKTAAKSGRTATKTAAKKTTPKKKAALASTAKKTPQAKPASRNGKLSALDAAAKVLAESAEPMSAKQLIETMAKRKLWTSPGGKTPEATLYAAMIREIAKKGNEARFRKHDRGRFVAGTTATAKPTAKKAAKKASAKKTTAKKNTAPADGTPGPKSISDLFKI